MVYVYAYVCLCEFGPRAVRIVPEFGWYPKKCRTSKIALKSEYTNNQDAQLILGIWNR